MKKIVLSSLALFLFSASIFMFQLSCSKDANAGGSGSAGSMSQQKFFTLKSKRDRQFAIIDKNGAETIITVKLPAPFNTIEDKDYATDGGIIYFYAYDINNIASPGTLCTCDMNGNNVKLLNKSRSGYDGDLSFVF